MKKRENLIKKLEKLFLELENAKKLVDDDTISYLCRIEELVNKYIDKVKLEELKVSKGGNLGFRRAIIEYDNLALIDSLYNAAKDVDAYYCNECKTW